MRYGRIVDCYDTASSDSRRDSENGMSWHGSRSDICRARALIASSSGVGLSGAVWGSVAV